MRATIAFFVTVVLMAGCATRRPPTIADRFVRQGKPAINLGSTEKAGAPDDSLAVFIEKVRQLSLAARPAPTGNAQTIEASNGDLADALREAAERPGAESYRRVGEIYRKLGILDQAYEQFSRAVKADPSDAAAYDHLARIWRDWGFPQLGLGDAYRAVYFAPESPAAYNTLGTLFQRLGETERAKQAYAKALSLDVNAVYALNNMCSALLAQGRAEEAVFPCRRAVDLQPSLMAAQRNLAAASEQVGIARSHAPAASTSASNSGGR